MTLFSKMLTFFLAIGFLMASSSLNAVAQTASSVATFPLNSGKARQLPVVAKNGMVVAQEGRAAKIGLEVLQRGGNAVDASVATAFALAVTLPRAGNIGGGGFMMIYLGKEHKAIALDYRELAPANTPTNVFLDEQGNFVPEKSQNSGLGTGVPGTVAGMALALQKFGSGKFTWAQLIAPAIVLAREGISVDETLADISESDLKRIEKYPSSRKIFLNPDGKPYKLGEILIQRDLADTLQTIAEQGPQAFYQGPIAQKIVEAVNSQGGRMSLDDMANYQAIERLPVEGNYRGHQIISMPPPSSGGVHVIEILNILENYRLGDFGSGSAKAFHLMAEAMKLAYADRSKYLGDPDFTHVPVSGLISKTYAKQRQQLINPDRATAADEIGPGNPVPYESDQTTHFSIVDREGNGVANTYTLNFYYGVGLVAEGTGVLLNNELDDFAAKPGAPNAFGLVGDAANAPGPRKRPLSSMSPTFVLKDGELEIVTGSPGGSRIITTVVQIILDALDFNLNVAEAENAPRIHSQWLPDQLRIERGISPDTIAILQSMGHLVVESETIGSAQTIFRNNGLLMGASDPRQRNQLAVGF